METCCCYFQTHFSVAMVIFPLLFFIQSCSFPENGDRVRDDSGLSRALNDCSLLRHQSRLMADLLDDSQKSAETQNVATQQRYSTQHLGGGLGFISGRTTYPGLVFPLPFCSTQKGNFIAKALLVVDTHIYQTHS